MKVPLTNQPNIAIASFACCLVCSLFLIGAVSAQSPGNCPTCYPSYPVSCICPLNQPNVTYPVSCICPFRQPNVTYPVSCICPFSRSNASSSSCCSCPFGSSCSQTSRFQTQFLTPDFNANTTSGNAPLAVKFSDVSTGSPNGWLWEFGDGGTSTVQNPVHIFNNPGIYSVRLTITRAYSSSMSSVSESRSITKPDFISVTGVRTGEINQGSTPGADDSALVELRREKITKFLSSTAATSPFSRIHS